MPGRHVRCRWVADERLRRQLPNRIVQYRGWRYLNFICVHAMPRGNLRSCINAPDGGLLWQLCIWLLLPHRLRVCQRRNELWRVYYVPQGVQRGVLLSRERDDSNWRRDGRRVPDRSIFYRGWRYLNYVGVHAMSCRDVWSCDYAADCSLLWQLCIWLLLPPRFRVRQRRYRFWHVHYVP
jgi:hypothetical protein